MKAIKRFITRLLMGLSLGVMASPAMALDEVLEVEIHNATSAAIAPGKDFRGWKARPMPGMILSLSRVAVRS